MNSKVEFLYLSQEDVIAAGGLDMAETVKTIETSFRLHALGETILPHKPVLRWGGPETEETTGRIMAMPAYLGGDLKIAGISSTATSASARYSSPRRARSSSTSTACAAHMRRSMSATSWSR